MVGKASILRGVNCYISIKKTATSIKNNSKNNESKNNCNSNSSNNNNDNNSNSNNYNNFSYLDIGLIGRLKGFNQIRKIMSFDVIHSSSRTILVKCTKFIMIYRDSRQIIKTYCFLCVLNTF